MIHTSEIYLTNKFVTKDEWQNFINIVSDYNGNFKKWKMYIIFDQSQIHYYIKTKCLLPASINGLKSFILKPCEETFQKSNFSRLLFFAKIGSNAIDINNYFRFRKNDSIKQIEITFRKISDNKISSKVNIITFNNKHYKFILGIPSSVLSIDFESNYDLTYKKAPAYLDISKNLHLLKTEETNSILKVDTFPYLQGEYYLDQSNINFDKHSVVFGSSGSGKSKFLSLLISNTFKNDLFRSKYKIVVIDPHASLENDIGGLGRVIDFKSEEDSINLFSSNTDDTIVSVELLLDVFRGLIPNNYNSKLERVLRHSLYLLLVSNIFDFKNLRKLLLDLEFRNTLIKEKEDILPISIIEFFLAEYNDIKTKSYTEAISPIIALIDEMEMIPVFNKDIGSADLKAMIKENFLTIFSLDRMKLGDHVTKTISGLVMEQLLTLVQNYSFCEHIIFIVDEVAVIENPILNRFLAESRKYNLSLILAGQYFGGISEDLRKSIFANVINYYMFRVSSFDANILVDNFDMKIPLEDTREKKLKLMTELQDRECLVRINALGTLLPTMKCSTVDFTSIPRIKKDYISSQNSNKDNKKTNVNFNINTSINLKDILIKNSTSRKVVEK